MCFGRQEVKEEITSIMCWQNPSRLKHQALSGLKADLCLTKEMATIRPQSVLLLTYDGSFFPCTHINYFVDHHCFAVFILQLQLLTFNHCEVSEMSEDPSAISLICAKEFRLAQDQIPLAFLFGREHLAPEKQLPCFPP